MLDENSALIKTISDYQNQGKGQETIQYQWTLHRNLTYLASVADSRQNIDQVLPVCRIFALSIHLTYTLAMNKIANIKISSNDFLCTLKGNLKGPEV